MSEARYRSLRDVRYWNGNLTQDEMAKKIGISIAQYCYIERGIAGGSVKTWKRIQEVFGLTDAETWQLRMKNEPQK